MPQAAGLTVPGGILSQIRIMRQEKGMIAPKLIASYRSSSSSLKPTAEC